MGAAQKEKKPLYSYHLLLLLFRLRQSSRHEVASASLNFGMASTPSTRVGEVLSKPAAV